MTQNWTLNIDEERKKWEHLAQIEEELYMTDQEEIFSSSAQSEEEGRDEQAVDDDGDLEYDDDESLCGYEDSQEIEVGDEIEGERSDGAAHAGIVVGVIRNSEGTPVCYKVFTQHEKEDGTVIETYYDYIPRGEVTLHEMSGNVEWSLGRIGYKLVEEESGFLYFKNDKNGDVIVW